MVAASGLSAVERSVSVTGLCLVCHVQGCEVWGAGRLPAKVVVFSSVVNCH